MDEVMLESDVVRLEPLALAHVDALVRVAAEDPSLYEWNPVPQGGDEVGAYVADALDGRTEGHMLPFAIVRRSDDAVVGCTRFARIERWSWPEGHVEHERTTPDVCEIGYTWLARSATRTAINTHAKRLLLRYAFDTWRVHCVRLRTDVRNERSRNAIMRIGAQYDGIHRAERIAVDGTVRDSAVFSIVAADWPRVSAHLDALIAR